jgi:hypothetical protein
MHVRSLVIAGAILLYASLAAADCGQRTPLQAALQACINQSMAIFFANSSAALLTTSSRILKHPQLSRAEEPQQGFAHG